VQAVRIQPGVVDRVLGHGVRLQRARGRGRNGRGQGIRIGLGRKGPQGPLDERGVGQGLVNPPGVVLAELKQPGRVQGIGVLGLAEQEALGIGSGGRIDVVSARPEVHVVCYRARPGRPDKGRIPRHVDRTVGRPGHDRSTRIAQHELDRGPEQGIGIVVPEQVPLFVKAETDADVRRDLRARGGVCGGRGQGRPLGVHVQHVIGLTARQGGPGNDGRLGPRNAVAKPGIAARTRNGGQDRHGSTETRGQGVARSHDLDVGGQHGRACDGRTCGQTHLIPGPGLGDDHGDLEPRDLIPDLLRAAGLGDEDQARCGCSRPGVGLIHVVVQVLDGVPQALHVGLEGVIPGLHVRVHGGDEQDVYGPTLRGKQS